MKLHLCFSFRKQEVILFQVLTNSQIVEWNLDSYIINKLLFGEVSPKWP
jgi:hypothetical protein